MRITLKINKILRGENEKTLCLYRMKHIYKSDNFKTDINLSLKTKHFHSVMQSEPNSYFGFIRPIDSVFSMSGNN